MGEQNVKDGKNDIFKRQRSELSKSMCICICIIFAIYPLSLKLILYSPVCFQIKVSRNYLVMS